MINRKSLSRFPIVEGLIKVVPEGPKLIGSKCKNCGSVSFPKIPTCPNPDCTRKEVEEYLLGRGGKLWSYTIQLFQPPAPFKMEPFKPFGVGIVELPEGIRILGMLTTTENLRIGMEVELVVDKLYEEEGNEYLTWKWKPVEG